MKVLFTGGGTGGHVTPIVSIARELKLLDPTVDLKLFYIGPKDPFGAILLTQEGVKVHTALAGKLRRYINWKSIICNAFDVLIKIPIGIFQALSFAFFMAPDVVISKGGYGSFPVVVAAKILQIPIFLHEADVAPGLANRLIGKFALEIFVSFPKTEYFAVQKSIISGNPIRREILKGSREEGIKKFNITGEKPVIFVMGGSQGAQRINDVLLAALPDLVRDFEILHQTGENNFHVVEAEAKVVLPPKHEKYYHPIAFLKEQDMRDAYRVCDFVVSRAGSSAIFEIAAVHKPCILIPLPEAAQNHQYKNAYAYAAHSAAIVMEEPNFLPHFFVEKLRYLFSRSEELEKMIRAAEGFAAPKAGAVIAEYVMGYLAQ